MGRTVWRGGIGRRGSSWSEGVWGEGDEGGCIGKNVGDSMRGGSIVIYC